MKSHSDQKYQIIRFKSNDYNEPRHMMVHRETLAPVISISLYEVHLAAKSSSFNTRSKKLYSLKYLYQWFAEAGLDSEGILLSGNGLTPAHVRGFASALKEQFSDPNKKMSYATRKYINSILNDCSVSVRWFMQHYYERTEVNSGRWALEYKAALEYQEKIWREKKFKIKERKAAPDLTDDEIRKIEKYLRPENRSRRVNFDIAVRDYLIWRMVIEFGMRIGEVLAMRMQDIPTKGRPYFSIVRIEERGETYDDPRSNPPRPKTLSRDLGFLFGNTAFPRLINDYVTEHRYVWMNNKGKKLKKFILPHNFLIVAGDGKPLSQSSASNIAKTIRKDTGIDFHWHMGRHAFFNRAYFAAIQSQNGNSLDMKISDLVVWGGWSDEKSLQLYSERVRADRARYALSIFQDADKKWGALS